MTPLQSSIYELIKIYVERQSLVLEVLREIRPDFIIRAEGKISDQFTRDEWQAFVRKYASQSGHGFWGENDEWAYRQHGIGCHLTHTVTGEIIGWDLGSLKRFDGHWFADYVYWMLNADTVVDDNINIIKAKFNPTSSNHMDYRFELYNFIEPILVDLEEAGRLRKKNHECTLV